MERRKLTRRKFSYYMRVMNDDTGEMLGHLADISTGGFKLESPLQIPLNTNYNLRLDLSSDIASKDFMVFTARSRWIQPDHITPNLFNVGFQIVHMDAGDLQVFLRMFEKYGSEGKV
jgi:hypothetical protein